MSNDESKKVMQKFMMTNQKIEHLNAINPQLVQKILQDPNVKSTQKLLEDASTSMEESLKGTKKLQIKTIKLENMK